MQSSCAYCFEQGVGFDLQLGGDCAGDLTRIQLTLCFLKYRLSQHRCAPGYAIGKEARRTARAVQLDGAFDAYFGDAKSPSQFRLFSPGGDMQLRNNEPKGGAVVFVMAEDWHAAVKVGHRFGGATKTQRRGDFSRPARKQGEVQLGHGALGYLTG